MSDRPKRKITISIFEDARKCSGCDKSLSGRTGTIYLIIPDRRVFEFCGWKCCYKHIMNVLKARIREARDKATDTLRGMGYRRSWGELISKEELEGK